MKTVLGIWVLLGKDIMTRDWGKELKVAEYG